MDGSGGSRENREKRIRRRLLSREHLFLAVAQPAFRRILRGEMEELGFSVGEETDGGVEFSGRMGEGWRANLQLRTASRVYCRTLDCRAGAREELFRKVGAYPWELWLDPGLPLRVRGRVLRSRIRHEGEAVETLRDALQRRMSRHGGIPVDPDPGVDPGPAPDPWGRDPVQRVLLRVVENRARVSLDMSGNALHHRGYRLEYGGAPLREDLAAGLLRGLVTGPGPVVDGMTGSGTLAVEAALWKAGVHPGGGRGFLFQLWPSFREAAWRHLSGKPAAEGPKGAVLACDLDPRALGIAARNASRAGVEDRVRFLERDFFRLTGGDILRETGGVPGGRGFLVLNPPYGRRLPGGEEDFFRRLGRHIRESFPAFRVLVLFPNPGTLEAFGGRAETLFTFRHGGLRVTAGLFEVRGRDGGPL